MRVASTSAVVAMIAMLLLAGCSARQFQPELDSTFNFPAGRTLGNYFSMRYGGAASWNIGGLFLFMNYVGSDFSYNNAVTVELLAFTTPPSDGHCGVNGTKCLKYSRQFTCFGARPERELLDPASFDRLIELNDTHTAIICSKFVQSYTNGTYQPVTLPRVYIINPQTGEDQFVAEHSQNMSTELVATAVNTSATFGPPRIAFQGVGISTLNKNEQFPAVFVLDLQYPWFSLLPESFNAGTVVAFDTDPEGQKFIVATDGRALFAYPSLPYANVKVFWNTTVSNNIPTNMNSILYASDWLMNHTDGQGQITKVIVVLCAVYDGEGTHPVSYNIQLVDTLTGVIVKKISLDITVDDFPLLFNASINSQTSLSNIVFKQFAVDKPLPATKIVTVRVTNMLFQHPHQKDHKMYNGCGMMAINLEDGSIKWKKHHQVLLTGDDLENYLTGSTIPCSCHWLFSNLKMMELSPKRSPAFEPMFWFVAQTKTEYHVELVFSLSGTGFFRTTVVPQKGWMPLISRVAPKMQGVGVHSMSTGKRNILTVDFTEKINKNNINTVIVELTEDPFGRQQTSINLRNFTIKGNGKDTWLFGGRTFQLLNSNKDCKECKIPGFFSNEGLLFVPTYHSKGYTLQWSSEGTMQLYNMSKPAPVTPVTMAPTPTSSSSTVAPSTPGGASPDHSGSARVSTANVLMVAVIALFFVALIGLGVSFYCNKKHHREHDVKLCEEAECKTSYSLNKNDCV